MSEQKPKGMQKYPPEQMRYSFASEPRRPDYTVDPRFDDYYDPREAGINQQAMPQAYPQGYLQGYSQNYQQQNPQGYPQEEDLTMAMPQDFPQGHRQGYSQNYRQGYPQGYSQNYQQGCPQNYQQGYPQGYPQNYQQGYPQNYQQGCPQNYQQGYPQNYQQEIPPDYPRNYQQGPSRLKLEDETASEEEVNNSRGDYDYEGYESSSQRRARKRAEKAEIEADKDAEKAQKAYQEYMEEEEPKKKRNFFGKLLCTLQFILSAVVMGLVLMLDMLPWKYLLMGAGGLLLLWLVVVLFQQMQFTKGFGKGISIVCILILGAATYYLWQTNSAMSSIFSSKPETETHQGGGTETVKAPPKEESEPFVVYLTGNDSYGSVDDGGRSDVNILLAVNPSTGKIAMVTTPRDAYINLPDYVGDGAKDKLTHVSIYGIEASMDVLGDLYGVDVDYYVRINFSGFETIVDALGGVNVYSDKTFSTTGGEYFEQGYNEVNGQQALAFVRERYAFSDGDFQRGRNQMAMISAMLDKATSPSILMNYTGLLEAIGDCMLTNLPQEQISQLVKHQLSNSTQWDISSVEVQGNPDWPTGMDWTYSGGEASVVYLWDQSVEEAAQLLKSVLNGD